MTNLLGSHVGSGLTKVNRHAEEIGATTVQFFVGSPMTWSLPKSLLATEPTKQDWSVPAYVHAAYLCNPASSDPQVRAKTATYLNQQMDVVSKLGAAGLIIHGGHNAGGSVSDGIAGWVEVLDQVELKIPLLIENTAGGNAAPARSLEGWRDLWNALDGRPNLGVCIDSAHAFAGGLELDGLAERIIEITGRIDLIHANGTLAGFNSGRDKHSSLYDSVIPVKDIAALGKTSGAPMILETPSSLSGRIRELNMLRTELGMDTTPEVLAVS